MIQASPIVGAAPGVLALPFLPMIVTGIWPTVPAAAATPLTCCTAVSNCGGTGLRGGGIAEEQFRAHLRVDAVIRLRDEIGERGC